MAIGRKDNLAVRNLRDGLLIIQDGSGTPNQLEILGAEGDLEFTDVDETFVIRSRGKIVGRSQGDEAEMTVNFTLKFEQWAYDDGESTGVSVADALRQRNGASAWVSTDTCGPYSVDLIYKATNVCGGAGKEVLTFKKFHANTINFSEGDEFNTLRVEGNSLLSAPERTWEA